MTPPDKAAGGETVVPRQQVLSASTCEVELLISGIAVFAMLQLAVRLDESMFALQPRFAAALGGPMLYVYVYMKTAAVVLAGTFILHLLLRAQWVALVGMQAVYPDGVLWDRLRMGPVQGEVERRAHGDTASAIRRAEHRAIRVFAIGISIGSTLLLISLTAGLILGLVWLSGLLGMRLEPGWLVSAGVVLLLLPVLSALAVDHLWGNRLRADGRCRGVLSLVFRLYARLRLGHSSNPSLSLLSSHAGQSRSMLLVCLVMIFAGFGVFWIWQSQHVPNSVGNYAMFPVMADADARAVDPRYYDDQRNPARDDARPYIQSAVVDGAWLALVVPYQPGRNDAALASTCPAIRGLEKAALANATLDCLQRLHPVQLDGQSLADLRYDISNDARTARPALLAMIDVRALPPGRHELTVARPPAERAATAGQPENYRIPFWR